MKFFERHGKWLIAAAAILIVLISAFFLQKKEATPPAEATAAPTGQPAELTPLPLPATKAPTEPPLDTQIPAAPEPTAAETAAPEPTFSTAAADRLPQDELLYTLADVTPALVDDAPDSVHTVRNDSPDLSEELAELIRYAEETLPGTWTVTVGDESWRLRLGRDGSYSLTVGEEEETGTYTMTHRMEAFHTTLHLTPGDGSKEPYELTVCLALCDGMLCLAPKDSSYPIFSREGVG